ncbi:cbb3-type cytochrome c oxidase subunit 3 [Sphingorhabdus soli]|uniref:Cbb3-type cytochrome c oxidase subunit 3 n=1 Tax=Flavisphingopyxis soli TaxID=2601267 RepID=A0A5C6UBE5_9SPHN|nr:cbb3-type cytochrome c oxidase subunit 3 [Sphingorhabdus soli]TXC69245.1 cbb3-type cytochrome c oxidase subunit 3 [Sphingorhabdus soli]
MSSHSTYDAMRHFADSWALMVMIAIFLVLVLWPFRPGNRAQNDRAARMIFDEDDSAEARHDD